MKKILSLTFTFLLCFTCIFSSACGKKVEEIGIQLENRFENGEVARCVWDLYYFDGKIYMGSGDYDKNTGPTDICAYNLKKKKIEVTGRIRDEAALTFIEIDGKLYTPGTDPTGGSAKGDYYTLGEEGWDRHNVLPRAIHNFDLIKFDGVFYAGIGGDYELPPILASTDGGETYDFVYLYKNGEQIPPLDNPNFSRCYDFYTLNGKLYALIYHSLNDGYDFEIYRLDDGKFQFYSKANTLPITNRPSVRLVSAKAEYKGNVYLSTNYLYKSSDGKTFETVALPNNERVSDFFIEKDTMYILASKTNEVNEYTTTIYSYDLNDNEFKKKASFDYEIPPLSFVKVKRTFYVGMGNKLQAHEKNGALIKVKI